MDVELWLSDESTDESTRSFTRMPPCTGHVQLGECECGGVVMRVTHGVVMRVTRVIIRLVTYLLYLCMNVHEYLPVVAILLLITIQRGFTTIVFFRNVVGGVADGADGVCGVCGARVVGERVAPHEFHGVVAED